MQGELYLALSIIVPLIGAVFIAIIGKYPNIREVVTIITSVVLFYLVCVLNSFTQAISLQLYEVIPGIWLAFSLEPLGLLFAMVASCLWILTSIYSIGYMRSNHESRQTRFYVCFAIAISATMGIAFSANMFTLFLFYELLTISTYPLVTHSGTDKARQAGRVYLAYLLCTSIGLQLIAIVWTWLSAGTLDFKPGGILTDKATDTAIIVLFLLYVLGVGKAALMPFHRWLPAAMVAPTPVSALLHAVAVVKAGVFTILKIVVYIFGLDLLATSQANVWLIYLAGFTIVVASVIALHQDNLKKRLAYSTISQLSYVVVAAAVIAPISIIGAALHIAAHAFGKITLFFAAGSIYTASKKTEVSQLDGIGMKMPWTMTAFAIGSLSMIGIPPTAGFLSKWFILQGAYQQQVWFVIIIIIISTLLNAGYFLPIVYRAFFRAGDKVAGDGLKEAPLFVVLPLCLTAITTIVLFFIPDLLIGLVEQIVV